MADTLSLWPHLNSITSQTAANKHTSTKVLPFRDTQWAALDGCEFLIEAVCVFVLFDLWIKISQDMSDISRVLVHRRDMDSIQSVCF